jgi:hypothetical protein
MRLRLAGMWSVVAITACDAGPSMPAGMTAAALRRVPTEVRQDDGRWTLEAEGWRSFQPITMPSGDPLIIIARVASTAALGAAVRIESLTLARGDEVWTGEATEEMPRAAGAAVAEFVARSGPPWSAGDTVDAVATITDGSGARVLLRARPFAIARVH